MFEPVSHLVVPGDDADDVGCCAVTDLDCFVIEIFCKQPSLSKNSWPKISYIGINTIVELWIKPSRNFSPSFFSLFVLIVLHT